VTHVTQYLQIFAAIVAGKCILHNMIRLTFIKTELIVTKRALVPRDSARTLSTLLCKDYLADWLGDGTHFVNVLLQ